MPQPVSYNPGTPVSGSIQENSISYVVDGQNRNYRGGFGGLSWMSEVPAENNVIFIGNSTSLGRGPAGKPLFYPSYNNSSANIVYAVNTLPGSPRNFTTTGSAYNWAVTNNFFINNSDNPIPRIDADGLVLYVDANQPTSYPQTGTSWYDASGYGSSQALYNNPPFNTDGYLDFSTNEYSLRSGGGTLTLGDNYTISATVNILNSTAGYRTLVRTLPDDHPIIINTNTNSLGYYANGDGNFLDSGYTITAGIWMRIDAVGTNGTQQQFYINGNAVGSPVSSTSGKNATGMTWDAFGNVGGGSQPFGKVSNAVVYNKALTTTEIKQNYFQSNIVQDGLVFMVDANNIVSYPKSGTAWYNLTGSVASATLTNGPTFNNINGGIINFDGVDDYAVTSNFPSLSNWSTEMWLNPNVYTTAQKVILDVNLGIRFEISNGFFNSHFGDGSGWIYTNLPSTTQIAPNTWFHVIVTVDASVNYQAKVYVNGVLENTTGTSSGTTPNVPLYIARFTGAGGYEFNGKIANTRIYSKALTASEVQQNYQATKDKFQGQQIVTNGLVLNLDSANKDSYPGTGTTWTDLSGNGNNGTLTNGPSFLPNQNGGVFYFDGTDDNVQLGNASNFISGAQSTITINCWVRTDIINVYKKIFVTGFAGSQSITGVYFSLGPSPYELYFGIITNNGSNAATYSSFISTTQYSNICGTYDGSNIKIYLNGSLVATQPHTGNIVNTGIARISGYDNNNETWSGNIAQMQIYNRALSATEITQNYNATKGRFGL